MCSAMSPFSSGEWWLLPFLHSHLGLRQPGQQHSALSRPRGRSHQPPQLHRQEEEQEERPQELMYDKTACSRVVSTLGRRLPSRGLFEAPYRPCWGFRSGICWCWVQTLSLMHACCCKAGQLGALLALRHLQQSIGISRTQGWENYIFSNKCSNYHPGSPDCKLAFKWLVLCVWY